MPVDNSRAVKAASGKLEQCVRLRKHSPSGDDNHHEPTRMSAVQMPSVKRIACILAAAVVVACAGPVVMKAGQTSIEGMVMDRATKKPISGACVTELLAKGGFWTQPGTYILGFACSDPNGSFRIPSNPRRVFNASDPDSRPYLTVSAAGYHDLLYMPSPEARSAGRVTIELSAR
jgi:hypothetical protein